MDCTGRFHDRGSQCNGMAGKIDLHVQILRPVQLVVWSVEGKTFGFGVNII